MIDAQYEMIANDWKCRSLGSTADVDLALDNFRVLFAYNSNRIENPETTYHDTREIFDNGRVSGYTGELRTLFEIQNQKYCYDHPTVIYEEDKKAYCMAIAVYDKSEEISGFTEFIKEQTVKTWTKTDKPTKKLKVFL